MGRVTAAAVSWRSSNYVREAYLPPLLLKCPAISFLLLPRRPWRDSMLIWFILIMFVPVVELRGGIGHRPPTKSLGRMP